jgi:hypothetical protein
MTKACLFSTAAPNSVACSPAHYQKDIRSLGAENGS